MRLALLVILLNSLGIPVTAFLPRPYTRHIDAEQRTRRPSSKLSGANDKINGDTQAEYNNTTGNVNDEKLQTLGIGGVVYNVNRLKRNLLQEAIRDYKEDVLSFIRNSQRTEQEIVDKFSALVQASPVRTTTDSNLLDGTWWLVFESKQSRVDDLLDEERQRLILEAKSQKDRGTTSLALTAKETSIPVNARLQNTYNGSKEHWWKRTTQTYHLEELEKNEDPHVIEETTWAGGLFYKHRRSTVTGLTRRSLRTVAGPPYWYLFGFPMFRKLTEAAAAAKPIPQDVQVIYADVDMCILAHGAPPDDDKRDRRSFSVYTKDPEWFVGRVRRNLQWFGRLLLSILIPFYRSGKKEASRKNAEIIQKQQADSILREVGLNEGKLRVLKIGDLKDEDDEAWDGLADPFVHLTADERQEMLKRMNMREISRAGNKKLTTSKRQRWFQRLFRRRKRSFKGPKP